MADYASFDKEFMSILERDKLVFISEILLLGKKYGLTEGQVMRINTQAEMSRIGFKAEVFVYSKE